MSNIRVAIVGIGNCASSLVQGLDYYREGTNDTVGLMHYELGGYTPSDIKVVAAWDVDARKVGHDVAEAIFAKPNCTAVFQPTVTTTGTIVRMGKVLDGVADHMADYKDDRTFIVANDVQPSKEDVVAELKRSGADVLMNYLPVGSQEATEFYAECAIEAGVAFVNNIPVFIASNEKWAKKFEDAGVAIIGDDIKAQLGATGRISSTPAATPTSSTCRTTAVWNRRRSRRPRRSSRSRPSGWTTTMSTSARRTMCRGRTTTRSASCGWKASCSAACR
jgi:myo-inositol-1-phosphate synthase